MHSTSRVARCCDSRKMLIVQHVSLLCIGDDLSTRYTSRLLPTHFQFQYLYLSCFLTHDLFVMNPTANRPTSRTELRRTMAHPHPDLIVRHRLPSIRPSHHHQRPRSSELHPRSGSKVAKSGHVQLHGRMAFHSPGPRRPEC